MTRLLPAALITLLAGCSVPGLMGPGGGALALDVLAVTAVDAETAKVTSKVHLRWNAPPNARLFEVVRKFGDQAAGVKASQETPNWTDESLEAGQTAAYTVRALGGDSKALTVSDEKTVTVLKNEVAKPTGLKPVDNARIGVGETPMLSWEPVPNATWYHVRVIRGDNDVQVYAALTRNTSVKLGEASPITLPKFEDILPTGGDAGLARAVLHKWTVSAVRTTGGDDPARVTAIDVTPSAVQGFIPGG
jgi:hypothetical protein